MSFLWPEALGGLALIPVCILVYILIQRQRKKYALRYASLQTVKEARRGGPGLRRHIPAALFLLGLSVMVLAMARPTATIVTPSQQGTVILAIDCSMSMRGADLPPSRLEAAKAAARLFVEKQPKNVRIGVVSFSSNASIVLPPTKDREAITAAVNRLTFQSRTAVGSAILTSLEAIFEEPGKKPQSSPSDVLGVPEATPTFKPVPRGTYAPAAIVLLTDGMSNTGPLPLEAATQAVERGVRVYTVGVGSQEGATLNFSGFATRVRLDEDTLKKIAEKTDGQYFKAQSETDLRQIYTDLGSKLVFEPEKTELTAAFTGLAAVILLAAGLISLLWFHRLP